MPKESDRFKFLESFAYQSTRWSGSSWAFLIALGLTLCWFLTGPLFDFSDSWQLVMDTVSSAVTLLMVFLLQRSQNKDALAMQIKLNEIIAALQGANNKIINIEDLSEREILSLQKRYQKLATHFQEREEPSTHTVSAEELTGK
jgi:low affinity Fe/Cu permease